MATSIGFDVVAHDRASRTLDKVGSSAGSTSSKFKTLGKAAKYAAVGLGVGMAAAAKGLWDAGQKAGDLSETVSKTNQIFGSGAGRNLEKWAAGAATSLGQSKQTALDAAATFGVFGKSAGKSGMELARFAKQNTSLATDLASFHNASPEEAIEALGAAFRGEAEPMRRFGVLLDDASMRQQALKMGLVKTTKEALTPQQKVLTAQALIMKQTSDAQGDFERTSGGLANQQRILRAQLENTQVSIGQKMLPVMLRLATFANTTLVPAIGAASKWIGQNLGPSVARLGGWIQSSAMPALTQFGGYVNTVIVPMLARWGMFLTGTVIPAVRSLIPALVAVGASVVTVAGFFSRHQSTTLALVGAIAAVVAITKVHTAVMAVQAAGGILPMLKGLKLVAAATRAYAAVQWVLNAALSANPIGIAVVALAALGVALAIAWRKSDTFRAVVTGAFNGIRKVVTSVVSNVVGFVRNNWRLLIAIIAGPLGIAVGLVTKHWGSIRSATIGAWNAVRSVVSGAIRGAVAIVRSSVAVARAVVTGAWNAVRSSTSAIWNGIKSVISSSIAGWMSIINGIRGRVLGAFSGAGSWLLSAGRAIIGGLIDGVQNMIGSLTSKLSSITKLIPKLKGPLPKDRKLLQPAGEALIEGLIAGITKKWTSAERILKALTGRIKATGEKVKSLVGARSEFAKGFQGFSGSMFGLDLSGTSGDADAMLNYQQAELEKARQLRVDVARLTKAKLSGGLLKQLQASGEGGIAQIHALAQGTDQQIRLAGSLHAQTQAELGRTGANAAQALYGDDIKAAQRENRLARKIGEAVRRELNGRDADEVVFRLRGDELVGVLKRTKRVRGNKPLGIS